MIGDQDGFSARKNYDAVQYFPNEKDKYKEIYLENGQVISQMDDKKLSSQDQVKRYLVIKNPGDNTISHSVEHIHFKSWPDF